MRPILASDQIQLEQDLPELGLPKGAKGVVVSTWFYPNTAYEVEFEAHAEQKYPCRALLLDNQLVLTGASATKPQAEPRRTFVPGPG